MPALFSISRIGAQTELQKQEPAQGRLVRHAEAGILLALSDKAQQGIVVPYAGCRSTWGTSSVSGNTRCTLGIGRLVSSPSCLAERKS
jgi:hypothetical protein